MLADHYRTIAETRGCWFLDPTRMIHPSDRDGIHLEAGDHAKLGIAVAVEVRKILALQPG